MFVCLFIVVLCLFCRLRTSLFPILKDTATLVSCSCYRVCGELFSCVRGICPWRRYPLCRGLALCGVPVLSLTVDEVEDSPQSLASLAGLRKMLLIKKSSCHMSVCEGAAVQRSMKIRLRVWIIMNSPASASSNEPTLTHEGIDVPKSREVRPFFSPTFHFRHLSSPASFQSLSFFLPFVPSLLVFPFSSIQFGVWSVYIGLHMPDCATAHPRRSL